MAQRAAGNDGGSRTARTLHVDDLLDVPGGLHDLVLGLFLLLLLLGEAVLDLLVHLEDVVEELVHELGSVLRGIPHNTQHTTHNTRHDTQHTT